MSQVSVNPDLQKERDSASFDSESLAVLLHGKDNLERRRYFEKQIYNDSNFPMKDTNFLSRDEVYLYGMQKTEYLHRKAAELGVKEHEDFAMLKGVVFNNEAPPLNLNYSMFWRTINMQASPEQQEKWLPLIKGNQMLGTYAQTELGHGTHVRGLETTAHYEERTQEFVLHSPSISSIKFWPGGLGKTSNYAVVMAQLYTQGVNRGLQAFLVQLRDMDTHQPLPGITLGDIGPKFGYAMIDNGFLGFDNVRIPRANMFMKNAQVLPDGTFVKAKHPKLLYGVMVLTRTFIVVIGTSALAKASAISIRYSCVRRQSELQPGGAEPQILDYTTQQFKLFTNLAAAYALWFVQQTLFQIHGTLTARVEKGDLGVLQELHALAAGLKAYSSDVAQQGMEVCRMSCGGHGFSHACGIPKIYGFSVTACTFEGENTVLYLQTGRYLMKMCDVSDAGQPLAGSVAYLGHKPVGRSSLGRDMSVHGLVAAAQRRAYSLAYETNMLIKKLEAHGKPSWEARNLCGPALVKTAKAHCEFFIVSNFAAKLQEAMCPRVQKVLTKLCQLFALSLLTHNAADLMKDGYLSADQLAMAEVRLVELLAEIRPDAVALVDAFDFSDHALSSILGRYDGNVYENMYTWAKSSPLNKSEVHEAYYKYQRPMMQKSKI